MNDTGVIVASSLCKPRQSVTSNMLHRDIIYLNLVTVFGNAMQTNIRKKFAHEGTEIWKRENRPFRAFFFLFLEQKKMLTLGHGN